MTDKQIFLQELKSASMEVEQYLQECAELEKGIQAFSEKVDKIHFEECPEEWADRPSMYENSSVSETVEPAPAFVLVPGFTVPATFEPKFNRNGLQNIDIPVTGNDSKPTKPTFLGAIKSALSAFFRRNATI